MTLNLATTFKPAFSGTQNIYMYAADTSGSNTRLAAARQLDGRRGHSSGGFSDAEFRIGNRPKLRVRVFRYCRNGKLVMGLGLVQPHVRQ